MIRATVLLTALTSFIPVVHAQSPTTLDYPGAASTYPTGINNNGQIAGFYTIGSTHHAFLYNNGTFSNFDPPCYTVSVNGISDSGQIVGWCSGPASFIYNGSAVTWINFPGGSFTTAFGISSNGAYVVGTYGLAPTHGFLDSGGVYTTIDYPSAVETFPVGVNDSGTVVGFYYDAANGRHSFLYKDGVFTTLVAPSATDTEVVGINNSGTVVGYSNGSTAYQSFLYNDGIFTTFNMSGLPSGIYQVLPSGINDNDAIIGTYADAGANVHGFLYPSGVQGYVNPKYLIMGVSYAPPGGSASSVSYQTTNVVGNTSTITSSFQNGFTVTTSISATVGVPGVSSGKVIATYSNGWTQKSTTSNEVTITKTSSTTLKTPGVPTVYSPVDHDYDIIWLWLNPVSVFTLPNTNIGGPLVWNGYGYDLSDPLQDMDVWPVYVGYLNGDFGLLDPQDADALARSWVTTQTFAPGQGPGITSSDYPNILNADPFANNPYGANSGYILKLTPGTSPAISTDLRFTASSPDNAAPQAIPYAQAPPNSAIGIQATYQSVYSSNTKITQTADYTYSVGYGLDVSIDAGVKGFFTTSTDIKTEWKMTWDNSSQTVNTNTNTQTDTAVITGPPCPATTAPCNPEYTEPHEFAVYIDNLYGTFMFWPNPYFSISKVAPAASTVAQGSAANFTIFTLANAGYTGTSISFNVTGLPAGASTNQGTVDPGSPFALTVTTTSATPTGSYPLTISATDGSQSYFAYATLAVKAAAAPDFLLSSNPTSATVSAGNSAPFTVTVTPQGSFNNSISLSCSGLPALASCTFSPTTVTPNANTATSNLSIATMAHTAFLVRPTFGHQSRPLYAIWLALPAIMLLGTVALATPNRKKLLSYILVCLLAVGCLLQAACGNSGGGGSGGTGGTPAGTYTITVTGTAGSAQHTTTLTLTVQ